MKILIKFMGNLLITWQGLATMALRLLRINSERFFLREKRGGGEVRGRKNMAPEPSQVLQAYFSISDRPSVVSSFLSFLRFSGFALGEFLTGLFLFEANAYGPGTMSMLSTKTSFSSARIVKSSAQA